MLLGPALKFQIPARVAAIPWEGPTMKIGREKVSHYTNMHIATYFGHSFLQLLSVHIQIKGDAYCELARIEVVAHMSQMDRVVGR